jgi:predicted aspartyl protease
MGDFIGSRARLKWPSVSALLLILAFCATEAASATERNSLSLLPNEDNWPIVTISINGQSTSALIDTGATIAVVDDNLLDTELRDQDAGETKVLGLGGQRTFPLTRVSSIAVGAQSWSGIPAAVNTKDEFPIEQCVLPAALFVSQIIDFDFPNDRVDFYEGYPKFARGKTRSSISYTLKGGLIYIPVRINGVRGKALVDTGASVSFVNPSFAERARGVRRIESEKEMHGADLSRNRIETYNLRDFKMGKFSVSRMSLPILDSELFHQIGFENEPMMVIGVDYLENFRVQIDQGRKRIVFLH